MNIDSKINLALVKCYASIDAACIKASYYIDKKYGLIKNGESTVSRTYEFLIANNPILNEFKTKNNL